MDGPIGQSQRLGNKTLTPN
uniref:Uncharacterized protein n=1 Tax=Rhizophora mucronata TaxID=61149 RepID=A0A2P2N6A2_RHIMU